MEVTALHTRQMIIVWLLLALQVDYSYSKTLDAFPRVDPNRQQFFKYEGLNISCEGLAGLIGWRVMKKVNGVVKICSASWSTSRGPCKIKNAYPEFDSGEFWCEMGGTRTNTVNLTVTAGSVILESPASPVMEGDNVTLSCRMKTSSSNLTALFYKDGALMDQNPTGIMTISSVSRSYEGLYKCSFSGAGESAESWLGVRETPTEDPPSPQQDTPLSLLLAIGVGVFLVIVSLSVGLMRSRKHQTTTTVMKAGTTSSNQSPLSPQTDVSVSMVDHSDVLQTTQSVVNTPKKKRKKRRKEVSEEDSTGFPLQTTYATVTEHKKQNRVPEEDCAGVSAQTTYAVITKPKKMKNRGSEVSSCTTERVPTAGTSLLSKEEDHYYCTIDGES